VLVEGIARSIFVEIIERQDAQIREVITVIPLVENLTEEDDELELVAEVERLSQRKIFVVLMIPQVFQQFTLNAIFTAIIFVAFLIARTVFVPHVAVNSNGLPHRRKVCCVDITQGALGNELGSSFLAYRTS
jgi:hypothetical protein